MHRQTPLLGSHQPANTTRLFLGKRGLVRRVTGGVYLSPRAQRQLTQPLIIHPRTHSHITLPSAHSFCSTQEDQCSAGQWGIQGVVNLRTHPILIELAGFDDVRAASNTPGKRHIDPVLGGEGDPPIPQDILQCHPMHSAEHPLGPICTNTHKSHL